MTYTPLAVSNNGFGSCLVNPNVVLGRCALNHATRDGSSLTRNHWVL